MFEQRLRLGMTLTVTVLEFSAAFRCLKLTKRLYGYNEGKWKYA
jgi:hypothetical protein